TQQACDPVPSGDHRARQKATFIHHAARTRGGWRRIHPRTLAVVPDGSGGGLREGAVQRRRAPRAEAPGLIRFAGTSRATHHKIHPIVSPVFYIFSGHTFPTVWCTLRLTYIALDFYPYFDFRRHRINGHPRPGPPSQSFSTPNQKCIQVETFLLAGRIAERM